MKKSLAIFAMVLLVFSGVACRVSSSNLPGLTTQKPTESATAPEPQQEQQAPAPQINPGALLPNGNSEQTQDMLINLYEKVNPGVVAIQTTTSSGGGLGSGFVFDKKGHIVTNYHVVEDAKSLEVDLPSGIKVEGKVIGSDLDSDLAVVKIDVDQKDLSPLPLGNSDSLKVGQLVVAIGNPFGLSGSMTLGIVSAKGRTLESLRQAESGSFFTAGDVIQTDAAINPGNSGGPLLNLNGEVIGLNRAIRTVGATVTGEPTNSGIGFAVSVNIIKRVAPALIQNGKYDYPYLGVSARESLSLADAQQLGLSRVTGAYVISIVNGGPADKAGLRGGSTSGSDTNAIPTGGDLIVAVDGRPVRVFGELLSYLMTQKSPGDKIVLTIVRDDAEKEVEITLGKRP
jgi:2-alkenal reductase